MTITTADTAAIESLRAFAVAHLADDSDAQFAGFAHMCTCALSGEAWAIERFIEAFDGVHDVISTARRPRDDAKVIGIIRSTDTTRPDGAIARTSVEI